ncbi:hypothetical protein LguiB_034940 [Lonicera macranthoides]
MVDTAQSANNVEGEVGRVSEMAKELQESASSHLAKTTSEEHSIRQRALALNSSIRRLRSLIISLSHNHLLDPNLANKLEDELNKATCILVDGDVASFLPGTAQGSVLKMFLGPINVRATRKDVQLKVKEEYNSYRDRTALLFLFFPSMLLTLRSWIWDGCLPAFPVQLYQAWLLFLYTGLALRENILRVNGSDIRPCSESQVYSVDTVVKADIPLTHWLNPPVAVVALTQTEAFKFMMIDSHQHPEELFLSLSNAPTLTSPTWEERGDAHYVFCRWIYHHYCAMIMALVSLTWEIKGQPNCTQKQSGLQLFLQWAMMQGVAMLLQNRYQRQRLYTRIALGKAKRMDVVWGETAGVDGQLWLLYPILFILQGFEAYVGLLLLMTAFAGVDSEWQVVFCGVLLVLMAAGNFTNTVQTLMAKSKVKAKMRSKSRPELD